MRWDISHVRVQSDSVKIFDCLIEKLFSSHSVVEWIFLIKLSIMKTFHKYSQSLMDYGSFHTWS